MPIQIHTGQRNKTIPFTITTSTSTLAPRESRPVFREKSRAVSRSGYFYLHTHDIPRLSRDHLETPLTLLKHLHSRVVETKAFPQTPAPQISHALHVKHQQHSHVSSFHTYFYTRFAISDTPLTAIVFIPSFQPSQTRLICSINRTSKSHLRQTSTSSDGSGGQGHHGNMSQHFSDV